jgi:signal peptidase II
MTLEPENVTRPESPSLQESGERGLRPRMFLTLVLVVFAADQISKAWIEKALKTEGSRRIIGDAFTLTLTHNPGGAWGLAPHNNGLFILFAAVAVIALLFAYHRLGRMDLIVGSAFALALGGALGNLLDRLRYGYVVDFFDVRIIRWPVFNIADSAISLSIALLLLHFLRSARQEASPGDDRTVSDLPSTASGPLTAEDVGSRSPE